MDGRHDRVDLATAAIVLQPLGEGPGLAEMIEHLSAFTKLTQYAPQFKADFKGLLHHGPTLRQCVENTQRLLEPGTGCQ